VEESYSVGFDDCASNSESAHTTTYCKTLQHNCSSRHPRGSRHILQRTATPCNTTNHHVPQQRVSVACTLLAMMISCVAVCCSVLQCVAVCCSVLQCVAVFCSAVQCGAVWCSELPLPTRGTPLHHTATHCNALRHTATHCDTLQHTAKHCNTLQSADRSEGRSRYCNTLQHTTTHFNTLQHTATRCSLQTGLKDEVDTSSFRPVCRLLRTYFVLQTDCTLP